MNTTLPEIVIPVDNASASKLETITNSPIEFINPLQIRRPSSPIEIDACRSQVQHPPCVTASLSVEDGNLSMTVVLEPSRSQKALRLSFPGSFPIEVSSFHHRLHTDDTADSRSRFSFYSDESLGGSSDWNESWPEIENANGLSTHPVHRVDSTSKISLRHSKHEQDGRSSRCLNFDNLESEFMTAQGSMESEIDPHRIGGKAEDTVHDSGRMQRAISTVSCKSKAVRPIDRLVRNFSYPAGPVHEVADGKCVDLILRPPQPVVSRIVPGWPTNNILDLFPSPPLNRALVPKYCSRENVMGPEVDDFMIWLQEIQARFDSRQSMIKKKDAIVDLRNPTLQAHQTRLLSRNNSSSSDINTLPFRLPSFDFDTYHGVRNNNMHPVNFPIDPQIFNDPANRPLSVCSISIGGALVDLCEEPEFTENEELHERRELIKRADLEEAQRCIIKDEQGRRMLFKDVIRGQKTIVIFLRFFWCAKCQDYVRSISKTFAPGTEERRQLDETKTTVIFIGSGSWKMISSYRAFLGCSFNFYTDMTTTSRLFRKMGLNRILLGGSSDRSILNPTLTIWQTMVASAKSIPNFPFHRPGSFTQLGGEFCLQNLSAELEGELTPNILKPKPGKIGTAKFSLRLTQFSRKSQQDIPVFQELNDPFRRSYNGRQTVSAENLNTFPIIKCLYANRMKSSRSHGNYHLLFKSIGLNVIV